MATPRDTAETAQAIETATNGTTQPGIGSSIVETQGTENTVGQHTSLSPTPDRQNEEHDCHQADSSSGVPAEVVATSTPSNERSYGETGTEHEPQNTRNDAQIINTENNLYGREEHAFAGTESVSDRNVTLPIRTSSMSLGLQSTSSQGVSSSPSTSNRRQSSGSTSRRQFIGPDGQVVDLETIMFPLRSSSVTPHGQHGQRTQYTQHTPRHHPGRRSSLHRQLSPTQDQEERYPRETPDFVLPRWQLDAEVTLCPICNTQFSIWVRKHHCRKCGRVVCASCSPHRITIPNQYIVRPPGSEASFASSLFSDPMIGGYLDTDGISGGERVRLCNPCVPDPNTAPPQSPTPLSPRTAHGRSRSSVSSVSSLYDGVQASGRYGGLVGALQAVNDAQPYHGSRTRSIALNPPSRGLDPVPTSSRSASYQTPFERYMSMRPANATTSPAFTTRPGLFEDGAASSRHRALPPTPQIAEEDECPVCHRELPSTALPGFEALREQHITSCIQSHSTYGSPAPRDGPTVPPPLPRRSGMYTYAATEKDCVDDAECTICLEEFAVGVPMARLECLCRFHRACIAAWFVNHPGRCPVHQHDGFGF